MEPNQDPYSQDNQSPQPQLQPQPQGFQSQAQVYSQPQTQSQFQAQPNTSSGVNPQFNQPSPQNQMPITSNFGPTQQPINAQPPIQNNQPSSQFDNIQQPVVKKKMSKKLVVIIVSISVALLIGIAAFLTYATFFVIDYKDAYTKSNEVASSWNDFRTKYNDLSGVASSGSDDEVSKDLDEAKSSLAKFKAAYKKLDGASVLKDKAIKEKYDAFEKQADLVVPKIETFFEVVKPLHDFVVKSKEVSSSGKMTDTEIDDIVSPLVNSSNQKLKEFGEEFAASAKKLYSAVEDYNAKPSSANYSKVSSARTEFYKITSDKTELEKRIGVVTYDDISNLVDAWDALRDKIADKYNELDK